MTDFRKKLGLDFLKKAKGAPEPESVAAEGREASRAAAEAKGFIEEAAIVLGVRILDFLAKNPDGKGKVFEVVEQTGMAIEEALQVTEALKSRQLLEVEVQDKFGNHALKITAEGRRFIRIAAS